MNCRFCNSPLEHLFVSLGNSPLSNAFLTREQLGLEEPSYPLDVYVCDRCFLVQLPEFETPQNIFGDYAYFSSYSDMWLKHAHSYVEAMTSRFNLDSASQVIEIASNDGYLLQYFKEKGVPVLGIEPAKNVAEVARNKGIPTETVFFGERTAGRLVQEGRSADLLLGNNVLAHVPGLNDFVKGLKRLLNSRGVLTLEFPHLMRLIAETQFDTIYHEHFSYFSFLTAREILSSHGLTIFDVEELPTHGGSLRIYAAHEEDRSKEMTVRVGELSHREMEAGFRDIDTYLHFSEKVQAVKENILVLLKEEKKKHKTIVGYGAAAKGNTLLNFCGVKADCMDYVADRNPYKQGRYLPGSRIPIVQPDKIRETKPDYVFVLPWNIKDEVIEQMSYIREWGGKFIIPIPKVAVV